MTPKTKLQKKADELCSLVVRARDPICRLCKAAPSRDAHHIFSRSHKNTRYDLDNLIGLCYTCHQPKGHDDPCNMRDRIVTEIGQELYDDLRARSQVVIAYTPAFLRDQIDRLKSIHTNGHEKPG